MRKVQHFNIQYFFKNIFLDIGLLRRFTNHPVHIVDMFGKLSPSAFIPFCSFGGNRKIMGKKIKEFHTPVCNSFRQKVFDGQLCYEVDLNVFKKNISNVRMQMKKGLALVLDFNYERQSEIHKNMIQPLHGIRFYLNSIGK